MFPCVLKLLRTIAIDSPVNRIQMKKDAFEYQEVTNIFNARTGVNAEGCYNTPDFED